MSHRRKNRHLDEPPLYTGKHKIDTRIECINYSDKGLIESKVDSIGELNLEPPDGSLSWIRIYGMEDSPSIIELVNRTGLNVLDAKDILTTQHNMSIEEYDDSLLVVMPVVYSSDDKFEVEQVAFIMGSKYLISIQETNHPLFDNIYRKLEKINAMKYDSRKTDFLLATLINEVVNSYGDYIIQLEDKLEDLEDELLDIKQIRSNLISDIQENRREVIRLRKLLVPFKEQLPKLLRMDSELIHPLEMPYFKDVYDQLLYILQTIESCREILSSLVDLYLNNNDVKMNMIMKQLTIVATIFIPLTFLVGVWGMNFSYMPELDWRYGYLTAWILMIIIGVAVWLYLKRKDKS